VYIKSRLHEWILEFDNTIKEDNGLVQTKQEVEKLNGIDFKNEEMKMDASGNEIRELIESLKNQGRILKKLQKELGIDEFPIPLIGGDEN
jgi:hypothetical protein